LPRKSSIRSPGALTDSKDYYYNGGSGDDDDDDDDDNDDSPESVG